MITTPRAVRLLAGAVTTLALASGLLTGAATARAEATPALVLPAATKAKPKKTKITTQPKSATIGLYGTTTSATLKVKASGTKLTYTWQSSPASGSWKTIKGATKTSYQVDASTWANGTRFRVKVKGSKGSVTSKTATLKVLKPTMSPPRTPPRPSA